MQGRRKDMHRTGPPPIWSMTDLLIGWPHFQPPSPLSSFTLEAEKLNIHFSILTCSWGWPCLTVLASKCIRRKAPILKQREPQEVKVFCPCLLLDASDACVVYGPRQPSWDHEAPDMKTKSQLLLVTKQKAGRSLNTKGHQCVATSAITCPLSY